MDSLETFQARKRELENRLKTKRETIDSWQKQADEELIQNQDKAQSQAEINLLKHNWKQINNL